MVWTIFLRRRHLRGAAFYHLFYFWCCAVCCFRCMLPSVFLKAVVLEVHFTMCFPKGWRCAAPSASQRVHHTISSTKGAAHHQFYKGCITPSVSQRVHYTISSTNGAAHHLFHKGCITPSVSQRVQLTICFKKGAAHSRLNCRCNFVHTRSAHPFQYHYWLSPGAVFFQDTATQNEEAEPIGINWNQLHNLEQNQN